jgi:hypothetical protein
MNTDESFAITEEILKSVKEAHVETLPRNYYGMTLSRWIVLILSAMVSSNTVRKSTSLLISENYSLHCMDWLVLLAWD